MATYEKTIFQVFVNMLIYFSRVQSTQTLFCGQTIVVCGVTQRLVWSNDLNGFITLYSYISLNHIGSI